MVDSSQPQSAAPRENLSGSSAAFSPFFVSRALVQARALYVMAVMESIRREKQILIEQASALRCR